jgi:hypothetical protein
MIKAQIEAFKEDAFCAERITEMQALASDDLQEFSIPTDKAGADAASSQEARDLER